MGMGAGATAAGVATTAAAGAVTTAETGAPQQLPEVGPRPDIHIHKSAIKANKAIIHVQRE
jgi:hypothetical protein